MSFKSDFHIHSWYSDGTMSPEAIVEKYVREEYDVIAITDHEVTDAIKIAEEAGKEKNLRVIAGIEFATLLDGRELHILGYYFDIENQRLRECLETLSRSREERNDKMLDVLNSMGYDITKEDLIQREGQKYVGKPHFARALVDKGYIKNVQEAFEDGKLLSSDEIKKLDRKRLSAQEAISVIREAGGIAVLAHPCKIKGLGERGSEEFKNSFDALARTLKKLGLKGIECIYPDHTREEELFFINIAGKYHLHVTEGSDFHGFNNIIKEK